MKENKKTVKIDLRLTAEEKEAFKEYCIKRDTTISARIRQIIQELLKEESKNV